MFSDGLIQPAERALQLRRRIALITPPVRQNDFFRLPCQHPRQTRAAAAWSLNVARQSAGVLPSGSAMPASLITPAQKRLGKRAVSKFSIKSAESACGFGGGKHGFGHHAAARKRHLFQIGRPLGRGCVAQIAIERHGDALRRHPLAHARACPCGRLRITRFPRGDVGVVDFVGRHQMPHFAQRVDLREQFGRRSGWASGTTNRHPRAAPRSCAC